MIDITLGMLMVVKRMQMILEWCPFSLHHKILLRREFTYLFIL